MKQGSSKTNVKNIITVLCFLFSSVCEYVVGHFFGTRSMSVKMSVHVLFVRDIFEFCVERRTTSRFQHGTFYDIILMCTVHGTVILGI